MVSTCWRPSASRVVVGVIAIATKMQVFSMHNKLSLGIVLSVLLSTAALFADAMLQKDFGGDPEAHPPITKADVKIIQRARGILNDPSNGIEPIQDFAPTTQKRSVSILWKKLQRK